MFISNQFDDRFFKARKGNTLWDEKVQEIGFPTGNILSFTLFNMKINVNKNLNTGTDYVPYIDDFLICFHVKKKNMHTIKRRI